jgi:hypothetical protein
LEAGNVLAEQADAAARRSQLSGDQIEVGGLAGAVGADDRCQRSLVKGAGHGIHRDLAAEADGQLAGRQSRDFTVHSTTLLTRA